MADIKDGRYTDPVSGKVVEIRGGQVILEHAGKLYKVDPQEAGAKIQAEGYAPATSQDLATHEASKRPLTEKVKTVAEHVATGAVTGPTAVIRGLGAAGEVIAGDVSQYGERRTGEAVPDTKPRIGEATGENIAGMVAENLVGKDAADEYLRARAQRAADHPSLAMAGELIGQTVGAVSAVPAMGARAPLAAKVTAGTLEGVGMGGSAAAELAYTQNTDLTGEKLVAAMGPMALLGGGAALLGAGASRLFQRSGSRAETMLDSPRLSAETAEAGPKGFWKRLSDEQVVRTTEARSSQLKRLGKTQEAVDRMTTKMADEVRSTRLRDGRRVFPESEWEALRMSSDDFGARLKTGASEAGENLGKFREKVWQHASDSPAYRGKAVFDMERFIKEADDDIVAPLRKGVFAESKAEAGVLASKLDEIKSLGANPSLRELDAARRELRSIIQPPKPSGGGLPPQPPLGAANLEKMERLLERHIEAATDKVATTMPEAKAGEYLALKSKFHALNSMSELTEGAAAANRGLNTFSLSEKILGGAGAVVGGLGSGGLGGIASGMATAAAAKFARERSSAVLAVLAERLSKNMDARIDGAVGRLLSKTELPALGPVGGKLTRGARTAGMVSFAKRDEDPRDAFVRHAREVHAAMSPAQSTAKMAQSFGPLYSHAPQLAQAATGATQRAAAYLASKLPAGAVSVNVFSPAKMETSISDEDLHKFATAWDTVNNPLGILDDLQKNMLTAEQVEAVKVVYPELFMQIQNKVREALTKVKEPPPYSTRVQLDLLLDLNGTGEPSLAPDFQRTLMNISQVMQQQQQQARPRAPTAPAAQASQYRTLSGGIAAGGP